MVASEWGLAARVKRRFSLPDTGRWQIIPPQFPSCRPQLTPTTPDKNCGTDFAVPVKNPDGKAVDAFASVKDSGVSVATSSYELEGTTASLNSTKQISHSGRTHAVLDEKVGL